ncbi:MAG: putative Tic20 family protein [Nitriliruptoraceae bacterium]
MESQPINPTPDPGNTTPDSLSDSLSDPVPPPPGPTPPPPPPPPPAPIAQAASDSTRRNWGALAHASSIVSVFLGGLAVLGPLVVWLVKKDDDAWVGEHAVEALNFQLTWLIGGVVGGIVAFIASVLTLGIGLVVFIPVAIGLMIAWLVFTIKGALAASRGETYRYPMSYRMVS